MAFAVLFGFFQNLFFGVFFFFPELNWLLISEHKSQRDLAEVSATVLTYKPLLRLRTFLRNDVWENCAHLAPGVTPWARCDAALTIACPTSCVN